MAKAAAKQARPRMGGGGRRRSSVDSRQMELVFASAPQPVLAPPSQFKRAPATYHADLFETSSVDAGARQAPRKIEVLPQVVANDEVSAETLVLLDIVDFMIDLWRKESGEDLRPAIFPR